MKVFSRQELASADLVVDACYQGDRYGDSRDDPINPLVAGVGNQGGIRYIGTPTAPRIVTLSSSLADSDWPDRLDVESGVLTYFGDNKSPGKELHATPKRGNQLLREIFSHAHGGVDQRRMVPPILVFPRAGEYRDVLFRGLAVPGAPGLSAVEDLVAVWKSRDGRRFQNYRAQFTILDVPIVSRGWLTAVQGGQPDVGDAPAPWLAWRESGVARPLIAAPSRRIRTKDEQLPSTTLGRALLERIRARFKTNPYAFEGVAAKVAQLHLGRIASIDLTRPYRDGGRDAVGTFRVGDGSASILVEFAMEAKCYGVTNSVGVREVSRLISRLRHRQFGVLVTTSFVNTQAYEEVVDDGHPVVIIAASDIADVLAKHGISSVTALDSWLGGE
jgi:hypothetical protein